MLHKLFHKQVPETEYLVKEVLETNFELEYKIETDQVKFYKIYIFTFCLEQQDDLFGFCQPNNEKKLLKVLLCCQY